MIDARSASFALILLAGAIPMSRGDDPPVMKGSIAATEGRHCVYGAHRPKGAAKIAAAAKAAIKENPENDVRVENGVARSKGDAIEGTPLGAVDEKGIISTGRKWLAGRTIHIKFLEGEEAVRRKVQQSAMEWTKHANIKFQFVGDKEPSEVRIAFQPGGSWSMLGTDALTASPNEETMNLGTLGPDTDDTTISSVVLHEFGHMLSLVHEHVFSGPDRIRWNVPKAIEYYGRTQDWSPEMVRQQVLDAYAESDAATTPRIDKDSIMMYPIPPGIANIAVGWNTRLSPTDIEFIGRHYFPAPGLKPTLLTVGGDARFGAIQGAGVAIYRFQVEQEGDYVVRVDEVPMEVILLADGSKPLARGESAGAQAGVAVGARLKPGEYTIRLRRKDSGDADSDQFEISVKKVK